MMNKETPMNDELKVKMNRLIYSLTKDAARSSFIEYLENCGITEEEYDLIKEEWEKIGMTNSYI